MIGLKLRGKLPPHSFSHERGQSLVELAVSLIILLVLLAGMVDLGRISLYFISIRDAAQEGAQYGSLFPAYCDQIIERAQSSADGFLNPGAVQVLVNVNGKECHSAAAEDSCYNKEMRVTVIQPEFPITMPFLGSIIGSQTIRLQNAASTTILRPECP